MTTALIAGESLLLVLVLVLVAGLLRSHAEILRRLGPGTEPRPDALPEPPRARSRDPRATPAPALSGTTPAGDAVTISFQDTDGDPILLSFLTSGCGSCKSFWGALEEHPLPDAIQPVIVTHGTERESPARLRELAPERIPVVMSSQAWRDHQVPGAPYFVLVDGAVRGHGVATTWEALASLIRDAQADAAASQPDGVHRSALVDERLAAAGIGPGHPSLYPGGHRVPPGPETS